MLANLPAKRACRQIIPNLLQKRTRKLIATANTAAAIRAGAHHKQILVKQTSTTGGGRSTRSFKYVTSSPNAVIGKNLNMRKKLMKHQAASPTTSASCSSTTESTTLVQQRKTRSSLNNSDSSNATETQSNPEKIDDFINTLRSKTRRVVSKITSSFRRPLKRTRLLRPLSTKATIEKAQSTSIEKVDDVETVEQAATLTASKANTTNSRATLLRRALSFRKSRRKIVENTLIPDKVNEMVANVDDTNEKTVDNTDVEKKDEPQATDVAPKKSKGKTFKKLLKSIRKNCRQKVSTNSPDKDVQPYVRVTDIVKKGTFIEETNVVSQTDLVTTTEKLPEDDGCMQSNQLPVIESQSIETGVETNEFVSSPSHASVLSQVELDMSDNSTEMADELTSVDICHTSAGDASHHLIVSPPTPHSSMHIKTPPSAKRRVRKLNDCIAMLTGKLQEKLGVPFLENDCNVLMQSSVRSVHQALMEEEDTDPVADSTENTSIQKTGAGDSSVEGTPKKRRGRKPKNLVMVQQRPIFNLDMPAEFPIPSLENTAPPDIVLSVGPTVDRLSDYYANNDEQEQPINLVVPKARHGSSKNTAANLSRASAINFGVSIEPSTSRFAMMGYQSLNLSVSNVVSPPVDCSPALPELSPAIAKYTDRTTTSELRKLRKTKVTPSSSPPVPVAEQLLKPIGIPVANAKFIQNIIHGSATQTTTGGFPINILPTDSQRMPDSMTIISTAKKQMPIDNLSRIIDEVASNCGIEKEDTPPQHPVICATQPITRMPAIKDMHGGSKREEIYAVISAPAKRKSKSIVNVSVHSDADASKVAVSEHAREDLVPTKPNAFKRKPKLNAIVTAADPVIPNVGLGNLSEAKVVENKPASSVKNIDSEAVANVKTCTMVTSIESVVSMGNSAEPPEVLTVCELPESNQKEGVDLSISVKNEKPLVIESKVKTPKKRVAAKKKTETAMDISISEPTKIVEKLPSDAAAKTDAIIVDSKTHDVDESVIVTNNDGVGIIASDNNTKPATKLGAKRGKKSIPSRGGKSNTIAETDVTVDKIVLAADMPQSVLSTNNVPGKWPETECQSDELADNKQAISDKPKKGLNENTRDSETTSKTNDSTAPDSEGMEVSINKRKLKSSNEDQTLAGNSNKNTVAEPVVVNNEKTVLADDCHSVSSIDLTNIDASKEGEKPVENVSLEILSKKNVNLKQKLANELTSDTAITTKEVSETEPTEGQVDTSTTKPTLKKNVNRKQRLVQEITPEIATNETEVTGESSEIDTEKAVGKKTNNRKPKIVQEVPLESAVHEQNISESEQIGKSSEIVSLMSTPTRSANRKAKPVKETSFISEIRDISAVISETKKSDEIVENISKPTLKKAANRKQKSTQDISSEVPTDKKIITEPEPESIPQKTTPKKTSSRNQKSVQGISFEKTAATASKDTDETEPIGEAGENVLVKTTPKKAANRKQNTLQEVPVELPIVSEVISETEVMPKNTPSRNQNSVQEMSFEMETASKDTEETEPIGESGENVSVKSTLEKTVNRKQKTIQETPVELPTVSEVISDTEPTTENVPAKTTPKRSGNRKQKAAQECPPEIVIDTTESTVESVENISPKTTPKKIAANRRQKRGTVESMNSEDPLATKESSETDNANLKNEMNPAKPVKKTIDQKQKSEMAQSGIHVTTAADEVLVNIPNAKEDTWELASKTNAKSKSIKSNRSDVEITDTEPIVLEVKELPKKQVKVDTKNTPASEKTNSFDKCDSKEVVLEVVPTNNLNSKASVSETSAKLKAKSNQLDFEKADTEEIVIEVKEFAKKGNNNTTTTTIKTTNKKAKAKTFDISDNEAEVCEEQALPKEDLIIKSSAAQIVSKAKPAAKLPRKSKALAPSETKVFDSSEDEELLPWDPEIGFVNRPPVSSPVPEPTPDEPKSKESNVPDNESPAVNVPTVTKQRKRRKNELAKIIADQLLESFKEVDQSRIEELKILHDLSIESSSTAVDDLLLSASLSATPPPKRKTATNIASDALVDLDTSFEELDSESEAEIAKGNTSSSKKPNEDTIAKPIKSKSKKVTANEKKANKFATDGGKLDHTISPDSMKRKVVTPQSVTKKQRRNIDQKKAASDVEDIGDKPVGKAVAGKKQGRGDKNVSTSNDNLNKTVQVEIVKKLVDNDVAALKSKRGVTGRKAAIETISDNASEKYVESTDKQTTKRRVVGVSNDNDKSIALTAKLNESDFKSKPAIPMKISAKGRRSTICGRSTINRPSVDTTVTVRETTALADRVKFAKKLLCEKPKIPAENAKPSKEPISANDKTIATEPLLDDKLLKAKIVVSTIRLAPVKPIVMETKTIPSVEVAPTLSATASAVVAERKSPPTISTSKSHGGKILKKGRGKRSPKKSQQMMPTPNADPRVKSNVNDLVAQIINDFTTSTIDSPRNNSPVVFGELTKTNLDLLNRTARNNELFNSLKYSTSKTDMEKLPEIGIATKQNHRPSYDHALMGRPKAVENLLQMDRLSGCMKSPMRAPFMSPRWEPSSDADRFDSTNTAAAAAAAAAKLMMPPPPSSSSDPLLKEPVLQKLWPPVKTSLIDEPSIVPPTSSGPEKSLFQNVKDKTKKLFGKMSKRKSKKSSDILTGKKVSSTSTQQLLTPKRPLLRPSILSATNVFGASLGSLTATSCLHSNVATDVDSCLKKLESSSLFVGKSVDFTENTLTNIFATDNAKAVDLTNDNLFEKPQTDKPIGEYKMFAKEDVPKAKKVVFPELELPTSVTKSPKVTPQKINRRRQTTTTRRTAKAPLPKPLTPPPNRAKRTTSPPPLECLNIAFIQDRPQATRSTIQKSVAIPQPLKSTKLSAISPRIMAADGCNSPSSSSGDTFLSQMVDKIRSDQRDQQSESEEDLCLAAIAKSLNNKIMHSDEFNNELDSPPVAETARPPSFVTNDSTPKTALRAKSPSPLPVHDSQTVTPPDVIETNQSVMDRSDIDLDENTNTELIDMDLEDCASVYTSFSIDTSFTAGGTVVRRKKRRQRKSIIYRKAKKFVLPDEAHLCDICNKTFRSVGGLSSHKMTLSHISKLSEREFMQQNRLSNSSDGTNDNAANILPVLALPPPLPAPLPVSTAPPLISKPPTSSIEMANIRQIEPIEAAVPVEDTSTPSATTIDELAAQEHSSSSTPKASIVSPIRTPLTSLPPPIPYLCQSGIEPISSPEQIDLNYDRYTISARPCIVPNQSMDNSRLALSQEERLFYECCSMLKGSDRSIMPSSALGGGSGAISASSSSTAMGKCYSSGGARLTPLDDHHDKTKPVTPKSNEQFPSYLVPPEHKGAPKIDINQFSDISSDSNPAYSCPQVPIQSETVFANEPALAPLSGGLASTSSLAMAKDHLDVVAGLSQRHFAPSLIDRSFAGAFADVGNESFPSHSLAGGPDRDDGYAVHHLAVKQRSPVYVQRSYLSPNNTGSIEQHHQRLLSGLTQIGSLDAGGGADGKIESTW